jgi:hypothetical protein
MGRLVLRVGLLLAAILVLVRGSEASAATWDPTAWIERDTLDLETDVPKEGPYWFPVWLVVLDGQVYVRLGSRAADRVESSRTKPYLGVRIEDEEFQRVEGVSVPEMADAVARAMADKYWSDIFVRFMSHPVTLRLVPTAPTEP